MTPNEEKTAFLAMCSGLIEYVQAAQKMKQGRLKGLLERLKKQANYFLIRMPKINNVNRLVSIIDNFDKKAGWKTSENHMLIYCNFLALLAEKYGYNSIIETIINIMDYFERENKEPDSGFNAGMKAYNLWEEMI